MKVTTKQETSSRLLLPRNRQSKTIQPCRPRYTLLIILIAGLLSRTVQAQTPSPEGLVLDKTWTRTNESGSEGYVTLEAFVTGQSITTYSAVPADIVLVVDQSESMNALWGSVRRIDALKSALNVFVNIIKEEAIQKNVNHKVAIVGFSSDRSNRWQGTNLLSTPSVVPYSSGNNQNCQITTSDYRSALVDVIAGTDLNPRVTQAVNNISIAKTTYMQYGLIMAKGVLDNRQVTNYLDNEGNEQPREQLVVFFTDGYPGKSDSFVQDNVGSGGDAQVVADATVALANQIKATNARIYSIGIFPGADPAAAYTTTYSNSSGYQSWIPEVAAANGLLHFISNDYAANEVSSWSASTTSPTNVAGYHNNGYYHAANNAEALSAAFTSIANNVSSVPMPLSEQTIVQDAVSEHFHLPDNASDNIRVYTAPFTGGTYNFGAKVPMANPNIEINGKTVQVTGFDFSENWVGYHNGTEPHGNKLIVEVPLIVNEGVWGDGIATNDTMSVIYPDGDLNNPIGPFPMPYANVLGEVWTVVVDSEPEGFDPMNIDSPEDLAWFISVVNGRRGYAVNGDLEPSPGTNGKLTADIDMSAHNWVAIGSNGVTYEGTFDGNGQVVTGLKNNASKYYQLGTTNAVVYPGMFGKVSGTVHDVFVLDCEFRAKKHNDKMIHFGILVDTLVRNSTLYNCEAAGRLMTNNEEGNDILVFGGLVGFSEGTIHSCISVAQLTGFTMGGGVGRNQWRGRIYNSMVNPTFNYLGAENEKYVGGLIAYNNSGQSNNCYVRFERENTRVDAAKFGMIAGWTPSGTGSSQYLDVGHPENPINVPNKLFGSGDGGGMIYKSMEAPYLYNSRTDYMVSNFNSSVTSYNNHYNYGWSYWKRTTAGNFSEGAGDINDDYPILCFDYACVGSSDGIVLDYSHSLTDMLRRHNEGNLNENTQLGDSYKKTQHEAIYGGTLNLYKHQSTGLSTADNVVVYIDEDVSLLHDESSVIDAYTCQTMKKYDGDERWHNVSSSLSNSVIGFSYAENDTVPHNWDSNPCGLQLSPTDDYALFPSDAPVAAIDFYCFYEPQYHWLNFKRNSLSHWHMDNYELNIPYTNETTLTPGKGYLLAIDKDQFLQNRGVLTNGLVEIGVTADAPLWTGLKGYNLLGNPYQSYLDFDVFVDSNLGLWEGEPYARTYAVYDSNNKGYVQYTYGASQGGNTASRYINMHQGFFVRVGKEGTAQFTNAMRTNTAGEGFRGGEQPRYPLVNLTLKDNAGNQEFAVLEIGRPENGGAEKLRMGSAKGRIYLRHDGENFAILFNEMTEGSQPLYFDAEEDGVFTLSWTTANADFRELTLVDNITGMKYDMLNHDSYTFEGRITDYKSRFKIIIGDFTGLDEEDSPSTGSGAFAFFDGSNWIVNGYGQFDVIDVMGRTIYHETMNNEQNNVSLTGVAQGVYLMRLADGQNVKVQKIVIR